MRLRTILFAVAACGLAGPVAAQSYTTSGKAEVVERNADGKATKVRAGGEIYAVCMSEASDDCINPRAAGLDWGDIPRRDWSGDRPAQNPKNERS